MKIEHIAVWVDDLEKMKTFYETYFDLRAGEKYNNTIKQFSSCFLRFGESNTRLELMHKPGLQPYSGPRGHQMGITHFAIAVGSKEKVNELTEILRKDGYTIYGEPRTTGDGYYESVVLDPEGNYLEITV